MADEERPDEGPSLELPSFGLRRKKKSAAPEPAPEPVAEDEAPPEPTPDPAPSAEQTPRRRFGRRNAGTEVTPPVPEPTPGEPQPPTEVMPPPLFVDEVQPEPEPEPEPDVAPEPGARKKRVKKDRGPGGYLAAALTGLIVGALMVAATWGALQGCEAVRGTSSCGQPGFLVLLVMLVLAVVVGALILKAFRVRDPGSTSFLGVGLITVVALIGFIDVIYDWWMFLLIPGVGLISFALAHAVTSAFVDTTGDDRHR